jgi:hypothetical protein
MGIQSHFFTVETLRRREKLKKEVKDFGEVFQDSHISPK